MDRGSDGCWCDVINDASQSFGRYNKETCGPTHIIDLDSKSEFTNKKIKKIRIKTVIYKFNQKFGTTPLNHLLSERQKVQSQTYVGFLKERNRDELISSS